MGTFKKIMKIFAVIAAIAGAAAAIYFAVQKLTAKKETSPEDELANYVSCSCCDEEFVSEAVVK